VELAVRQGEGPVKAVFRIASSEFLGLTHWQCTLWRPWAPV
jgi:hypothetical protein